MGSVVIRPACYAATGLVALLALGSPASAQSVQQASLAPVPASLCLDEEEQNPARLILACNIAIDSGKLAPRERARAHLRRAAAQETAGERSRAEADRRVAIRLFDSVIGANRSDSVALLERGKAYSDLGDAERALADYDETIRLDSNSSSALVHRGVLLAMRKAEARKAIADFDRALAINPKSVEALIVRADARSMLGEYGRALADLDLALTLAPSNARALVLHGLTNARMGNQQQAYADYTAALAADPQNTDALVNRAAISASNGATEQAIRDLDAALLVKPDHALAHFNRGYARFARHEYEKAIADYSAALSLEPKLAWAHLNRCMTRVLAGQDVVAALIDCDEALKLLPAKPEVRETRGFVYLLLGDAELAFAEYGYALASNANRPLALYGRGLARVRSGDSSGGEADKNAARALMPDIARAFQPYGVN